MDNKIKIASVKSDKQRRSGLDLIQISELKINKYIKTVNLILL